MRRAEALVAATLAVALLATALARWVVRRRRSRGVGSPVVESSIALGNPALLVDAGGAVVWASETFAALLGVRPADLAGRALAALSPDLAILARGLGRGPASGVVALETPSGEIRARAALVRVSRRPPRDAVVLRPMPAPPPLPLRGPAPGPAAAPPGGDEGALIAVAAAAREPIAQASRAASMLRLAAPRLPGRAAAALAELERALEEAERRVAAIALGARGAGRPGSLDLVALIEDVAMGIVPRGSVRVTLAEAPGRVLGDERALRVALREVLAAVARAGRGISAAIAPGDAGPVVEIDARGADSASAASLARALLASQGARVVEDLAPGGARVIRISLPAAPALALEPA